MSESNKNNQKTFARAGRDDQQRQFSSRVHSSPGSFYRVVIATVAGTLIGLGADKSFGQDASASGTPSNAQTNSMSLEAPAPPLKPQIEKKVAKNEIGASGDYMYGSGQVSLPVFYGISSRVPGSEPPQVLLANRTTEYYGGTLSLSHGQHLYFDLSYEHGVSTGSQPLVIPHSANGPIRTDFNYTDDWVEFYLRYNLTELLKGTRFKAYVRAGFTYISASMKDQDLGFPSNFSETDKTTDYRGSIGFGLRYALYSTLRFKLSLLGEGEGFYGDRTQNIVELYPHNVGFHGPADDTIDNSLYGGTGRAVLHAEWLLGKSGRLGVFADAGYQVVYTEIDYPKAGSVGESLYGPYAKVGLNYVF